MRKPRRLEIGARYHVIARANRQEFILKDSRIKDMFLSVIKRAKKKYRFSIQNICIMGNHIHLIMEPLKNENLSKIMQWILSVFAVKFNRIFNITGHVWYDRFKSYILGNIMDFLRTFLYITDNPVKAGIVEKAEDYKYNGVWFLRRGRYDIIGPPDPFVSLVLPGLCEQLLIGL